ncbi:MAG TPA: pentapeptide repeat-containing protein [Pseudonocardia sp.]|jgi:uncharacterized protein YjbI with pentapeptide repeats|nr:pentapeptide repeat-containing protein [Pseudonocardia sp.]
MPVLYGVGRARAVAEDIELAATRRDDPASNPLNNPADPWGDLRADCGRCVGLCCVAPAFASSADFAVDKPAGQPCTNLLTDFRCGIHADLRDRGFAGCTVFDCFGAGQHTTQVTFTGRDWRTEPAIAGPMFGAFAVLRQLHELRWYLTEALTLPRASELHTELRRVLGETERLTAEGPDRLLQLDVATHRDEVAPLLRRVSELVRAGVGGKRLDRSGADLIGRKLRGADLRGANLRGTYLIGADLRRADLRGADLIGADLRGADLRGADLTESLFLTQFQVNGALGDRATGLPPALVRPAHWTARRPPV